jgi:hypothetical protein
MEVLFVHGGLPRPDDGNIMSWRALRWFGERHKVRLPSGVQPKLCNEWSWDRMRALASEGGDPHGRKDPPLHRPDRGKGSSGR